MWRVLDSLAALVVLQRVRERERWVRALEYILKCTGRRKHLLLDIKVFQIGIALFPVVCAAPGKLAGVQQVPLEM